MKYCCSNPSDIALKMITQLKNKFNGIFLYSNQKGSRFILLITGLKNKPK